MTPSTSSSPPFDPVAYAQTQLVPYLRAICHLLDEEQAREPRQFFERILRSFAAATVPSDLVDPFLELSMSAFMGFHYSPSVALLLDQLLGRSQELTELLSLDEGEIH